MPEGTNVGSVYFDLQVRDTLEKQLQQIAATAQEHMQQDFAKVGASAGEAMQKGFASTQQSFASAVNDTFGKSVALAQAKLAALEKQLQQIAAKTRATAQQEFADVGRAAGKAAQKGFESTNFTATVNGVFSKSVALAQAKVADLERQLQQINAKRQQYVNDKVALYADSFAGRPNKEFYGFVKAQLTADKSFQRLGEQVEKIKGRIVSARERLAIEVQAAAEKQAEIEKATYEKTAQAAQAAASQQQAAAAQAHTAADPPAGRKINTDNALRPEAYDAGLRLDSLRDLVRVFNEEVTGSFAGAADAAETSVAKATGSWTSGLKKIGAGIKTVVGKAAKGFLAVGGAIGRLVKNSCRSTRT